MEVQVRPHRPIGQGIALGRARRVPLANNRLVVQEVYRTFDEHRSGNATLRNLECTLNRGRKIAHALDGVGPLHVWLEQRQLIDVLQRAAALQQRRRSTAQNDHGRLRKLGVFYGRNRVSDARARGNRSHAGYAGQPRDRVRGKDRRRLVTHVDDANAEVFCALENR